MSGESTNARMETALAGTNPSQALVAVAQAFKAEGMTQRDMYDLFDQYRAGHENDADETKYDAILDTMDFIVGHCTPNAGLFESDLSIWRALTSAPRRIGFGNYDIQVSEPGHPPARRCVGAERRGRPLGTSRAHPDA